MSSGKHLPPRFRAARRRAERDAATQRDASPIGHESLLYSVALMERAERWRDKPLQLPRGVELLMRTDEHGTPVYVLEWSFSPPPLTTPCVFSDPAVAVEMAWTSFMMRRPWAIDDTRLQAIVEHPPASHANILGGLLSIRLGEWVREAIDTMSARSVDSPPPGHDPNAKEEFIAVLDKLKDRFELRTATALLELGSLFGVEEPDAGMFYDIHRWRCMLVDYGRALDAELHIRVQALGARKPEPKTMPQAWRVLNARRRLDACVGLLLAYAVMREPRSRSGPGFTDPMATDAIGSFAWWCRWALEVWEDDQEIGQRVAARDVETFVDSARRHLGAMNARLFTALCRVFPRIAE